MPSVEETMGQVYDKMQDAPDVVTETPVTDTDVIETPEIVEEVKYEPTADLDGRVRDPMTGKFVPKPAIKEAAPKAEAKAPIDPTKPETPAAPEKVAPETPDQASSELGFQPPGGWSAAAKADFLKASPAIQAAVAQREKEVSEGFKQYEGIGKALHPVKGQLTQMGLSAPDFVNQLVQAHMMLDGSPEQRQQAMAWINKRYGITTPQQQAADPQQQAVDPTLAPLYQKVEELTKFQADTLRQQQEAEQSQAQALQTKANEDVEKFRADPKNEFFDMVRPEMGSVYALAAQQGLPVPTIQEAYERAIWANEKIRPIMLARQTQAQQDKVTKDASAKAALARRAVTGNVRGTQGIAPVPAMSIEQEMTETYNRMNGA